MAKRRTDSASSAAPAEPDSSPEHSAEQADFCLLVLLPEAQFELASGGGPPFGNRLSMELNRKLSNVDFPEAADPMALFLIGVGCRFEEGLQHNTRQEVAERISRFVQEHGSHATASPSPDQVINLSTLSSERGQGWLYCRLQPEPEESLELTLAGDWNFGKPPARVVSKGDDAVCEFLRQRFEETWVEDRHSAPEELDNAAGTGQDARPTEQQECPPGMSPQFQQIHTKALEQRRDFLRFANREYKSALIADIKARIENEDPKPTPDELIEDVEGRLAPLFLVVEDRNNRPGYLNFNSRQRYEVIPYGSPNGSTSSVNLEDLLRRITFAYDISQRRLSSKSMVSAVDKLESEQGL